MKHPVVHFLNATGNYSQKDEILLTEALQTVSLEKGEKLLNKGEVCSSVSFIQSGAIIQYDHNEEADRIIIDLNTTNDWVLNHQSFTSRKPSTFYIECYEAAMTYRLSIDAIHELIAQSPSFFQLGHIMETAVSRIHFFDNNNTPDEKYQYLFQHKPQLLQKFPQKLIASYLKITPETLSRVRHRFSKN